MRTNGRVPEQIKAAPLDVQLRAYDWIDGHLLRDPYFRPHASRIDSAQRKQRKGYHVRLGGTWRLIYVILPNAREVFVYDVVQHEDAFLYSRRYVQQMLQASRRNPADLATRIGWVLLKHPTAGDTRVAALAGCSPTAVRKYRVAHGLKARHTLAWEPWKG